MGVLKYVTTNYKIKTQFLIFFTLSVFIAAMLSITLFGYFSFSFYNKKISFNIQQYVNNNIEHILNPQFKNELGKQIPQEGFEYWVLSKDKKVLYASSTNPLPKNIQMISQAYSKKESDKETYGITFQPFLNGNQVSGGIVLKYQSSALAESTLVNTLIKKTSYNMFFTFCITLPLFILCPLIIVFIFALIFAKGLNRPLKELIEANNKIKSGNLDFQINTSYNNELGQVLQSFENMRVALQDSLKVQWTMEKQRKEMILSLTHDIKTPITVICGHLELLSGPYTNISEEQKEACMKTLVNNADRVRIMINELNEVWDLERPNFVLHMQSINIDEYLSDMQNNFTYICAQQNVNFNIHSLFQNNECFTFDPFRINEVFENILSNSLKYIDDNGAISIETFCKHDNLIFKVSDNGKGFTEDADIIFNKHYKGYEDHVYKHSSGLGLYISKLIVEKHDGKISAYNNANGGATIEISLPLQRHHDCLPTPS